MKQFFILALCCAFISSATAQSDVTMTITYHGKPVCNYDVTIKTGGVALGTGVTDNSGVVVFPGVVLLTPAVDVYAHKGGAADKHFEVKGWVAIKEDMTYELKMEEVLKEITSGSGMPESMFADSWGLGQLDCQ